MQVPKNFVAKPFHYHQELEFVIESLTNLGKGVGRVNGWVVMVPFVAVGERVRVRIFRNFKNYSDADLVKVLKLSPDRVEPKCSLFTHCGGCQYQHLSYECQIREKTKHVVEIMKKLGNINFPVNLAYGSPREYNYRSKITPHYNRSKLDGSQPIGFLKYGRRNQITDVEKCPIATDAINVALPQARLEVKSNGGKTRRKRGGTLLMRDVLEGVVKDPRQIVSERVGSITFQHEAGAFFQNNPFVLPKLVEYVASEASIRGVNYLIDAYCGVGLFALTSAQYFIEVVGVEISDSAVRWAQANSKISNISNVRFLVGKAEAIFDGSNFSPEETAVIIDPPRKGCDESFQHQLLQFLPFRIVYVSCDPATQARDLKNFISRGYQITQIQPFDLFPQTRHIENIVSLSLKLKKG